MYIAPQTNIRLISDCPLDPEYVNTLHWYSKADQASYFMSKTKYNLSAYTYQRYAKNKLRVEIASDNLYDVNYMMFQNSAFSNKWFYAFITNIEYVNNKTTEITYEIDDMQSWYLDYTLMPCFVERQHSLTDEIGDNILPENVELGEYVWNTYGKISDYESARILDFTKLATIVAIIDVDSGVANGVKFENMYTGARLWAFNNQDSNFTTAINTLLSQYVQKPDSVISMYTCPISAIEFPISSSGTEITADYITQYGATRNPHHVSFTKIKKTDLLDGYKPKNNKMYTYPYNFCNVENGRGQNLALRYEFFSPNSLTPQVAIYMNTLLPTSVVMQPENYKGIEDITHSESLVLDNYPLCCWSIDAWQAWASQNTAPMAGSVLAGAGLTVGALSNVALASMLMTPASGLIGIGATLGAISKTYQASIRADISKGTFNSGNVNIANGIHNYFVGRMSIQANYAEMIDSYFTRYGYAQNKIMTPTRNARAQWTYLKTLGCTLDGSIPADAEKKIQSIYDKGITIWINPTNVGNYSLDNGIPQG